MTDLDEIRENVRARYAEAATRSAAGEHEQARALETSCSAGVPVATTDQQGRVVFGADLYGPEVIAGAPGAAVAASLGCGVPTAVADLQPGQIVLDLDPAPAPTSSSRPAGSLPTAARSGWT